LQFLRSIIEQL